MATAKDVSKPYVENYPALSEWLKSHSALCNWQMPMGPARRPTGYVEQWIVGSRLCIITVWGNQKGWEIYTPGDSNAVTETLSDAGRRLGVEP